MSSKICILTDSLSVGGAEKAAAELSNLLFNDNKEVVIISLRQNITYPYSGKLINLGENEPKSKLLKQINKLILLRKFIRKEKPDYIIDFRMRCRRLMEFMLHKLVFDNENMIYVVQNYNVSWHVPKGNWFRNRYEKGKIIAVSKDVKSLLEDNYGFKNVSYIPNFVNDYEIKQMSSLYEVKEGKYIIALGRLTNTIKQHDLLIEAYSKTNLPEKGVNLLILGEGKDYAYLQNLIKTKSLQSCVKLMGYVNNPYPYVKNALFKVLSSKVEGMPLSIIEALVLNTPVISFNCKSGPSDMIVDNVNGILVKDQDFEALKATLEFLIENDKALERLKNSDNKSLIKDYTPETNLLLWQKLLN